MLPEKKTSSTETRVLTHALMAAMLPVGLGMLAEIRSACLYLPHIGQIYIVTETRSATENGPLCELERRNQIKAGCKLAHLRFCLCQERPQFQDT